jgi:hypothetical protein
MNDNAARNFAKVNSGEPGNLARCERLQSSENAPSSEVDLCPEFGSLLFWTFSSSFRHRHPLGLNPAPDAYAAHNAKRGLNRRFAG